jgi:hypothetical protein
MEKNGVAPNVITFNQLLHIWAKKSDPKKCDEVFKFLFIICGFYYIHKWNYSRQLRDFLKINRNGLAQLGADFLKSAWAGETFYFIRAFCILFIY